MEQICFRQWSNRGYAAFATLRRVIRICTLSFTSLLLVIPASLAQTDTTEHRMHYLLDEVEAVSEAGEELLSPSVRILSVISAKEIGTSPARSIGDLLNHHPQVDVRTRGKFGIQSDLNIQGGSFDQSLVLLNGINVSNPQTGHFNLDLPISPAQADRIELLTGPTTRNFGLNAFSGAVNIRTDPADTLSIGALTEAGQFGLLRASVQVSIPAGPVKTLVAFNHAVSGGYMPNTDFRSDGGFLHSKAAFERILLEVMAGWSEKDFGANAFYTPRFPEQYEETGNGFAALKWKVRGGNHNLKGQLYLRSHTDHFMLFRSDPDAYQNFHHTFTSGGNISGIIRSGLGFTTVTMELRQERIRSTSLGEVAETPRWVPGTDSVFYDRTYKRDHLSLAVNHTMERGRLMISGGAFFQSGLDRKIDPGIYPGIDLSFRSGDRTRLYASLNRSMRLPTFTDLFYEGPQNLGNPQLQAEKATTLEAGARYLSDAVRAEASLFYRQGRNIIDWAWENDTWKTRNIASLNTVGGEVSITLHPGKYLPQLGFLQHVRTAYSYTELSKDANAYISNYALDHLRHKWITDIRADLPAEFYLSTTVVCQDRNGSYSAYDHPGATPVEREYDPFLTIDVTVGRIFGHWRVYTVVSNLLNVEYRDIGSVVMPGRWIAFGVQVR